MTCSAARKGRSRKARGLGARPKSPRARELAAELRRNAEPLLDWAVRREVNERPRTRGDCAPCPGCQAYRDAAIAAAHELRHTPGAPQLPAGGPEVLPCGHTASQAINHSRPCLRASCSQHLYLDVEGGHVRYNFPDREVDQLAETCALDVADRGAAGKPAGWDETAHLVNLTSEGMRLMKKDLLVQIRRVMPRDDDDDE